MGQEQSKRGFKDNEMSANKREQKSKTVSNKTNCTNTVDDEQLSTSKAIVRSEGHDSVEETQTIYSNPKEENAKKETNEKINENENAFVVLNKKRANTSRCQEYKNTKIGLETSDFSKEDVEQTFQDVQYAKPKKNLNRDDVEHTFQNVQDTKPKKDLNREDAGQTFQDVQYTLPMKDLNRDVEKSFQDVRDTKPMEGLKRKNVEQNIHDIQDTKPEKDLNREDLEQNIYDVKVTKPKKEDLKGRKCSTMSFSLDTTERKSFSLSRTSNDTKINNNTSVSFCNKDASNQRNLLWEELYALIQKQLNLKQREKAQLVAVKVCKVMLHSVVSSTKEILMWLFLIQMLSSREPTSRVTIKPSEHKTFYNLERKCEMSYKNIFMTNLHPYRRVWLVFAVGDDSGYDPDVWLFTSSAVITAILQGQERDRHLRLGAFRLATFGFYIHAYMPENTLKLAREGYFCDVDGQVRCYQCSSVREDGERSSQTAHCPIPLDHPVNSIDDYDIEKDALLRREPLTDLHTSRQDTRLAYALTRRGVVLYGDGETKLSMLPVESEAGRGFVNGKENSIQRAENGSTIPRAEHGSTAEPKPLARKIIHVQTNTCDDPMNQMFDEWLLNDGHPINRSGQPSNTTSQNDAAVRGDSHVPSQNTTVGSNIASNAPIPDGLYSDRSALMSGRSEIGTVSPYEATITAAHGRSSGFTSKGSCFSESKRESMPSNIQAENTGNLQSELPEVVLYEEGETKLSIPPVESEAGGGSTNGEENSIPRAEHDSRAESKPLARRIVHIPTSSPDDPMNQIFDEWSLNNGHAINRSGQPSNRSSQNVSGNPYVPLQNTTRGSNITSNAPFPQDDTYSPIHGGLCSDRSALISGRREIGTVSPYEATITAEHDRRSGSTSEENRSETTAGQRELILSNIQTENTGNLQRELPKDDEDEETDSEDSDE